MNRIYRKNKFNPWISYSDLFSALILIFALITILFTMDINLFQKIIGKKDTIIKELTKTFEESNLKLNLDKKTGAINISNDILFAFNSDILTENGKKLTDEVIPKYVKIILSPKNREFISSIIIEGHTDPIGTYLYNIDLSNRRALSVLNYLKTIEYNIPYSDVFFKIVMCSGRGFNYPIFFPNSNKIDNTKSRRVEIKFELRDIEEIEQLLNKYKVFNE